MRDLTKEQLDAVRTAVADAIGDVTVLLEDDVVIKEYVAEAMKLELEALRKQLAIRARQELREALAAAADPVVEAIVQQAREQAVAIVSDTTAMAPTASDGEAFAAVLTGSPLGRAITVLAKASAMKATRRLAGAIPTGRTLGSFRITRDGATKFVEAAATLPRARAVVTLAQQDGPVIERTATYSLLTAAELGLKGEVTFQQLLESIKEKGLSPCPRGSWPALYLGGAVTTANTSAAGTFVVSEPYVDGDGDTVAFGFLSEDGTTVRLTTMLVGDEHRIPPTAKFIVAIEE